MQLFFRIKMFLRYAVKAKTKYYLHSPFVYQFYLQVIENRNSAKLKPLTLLRNQLGNDKTVVSITDFGAGNSSSRQVGDIARNVSVPHRYGTLLYSLVRQYKPQTMLELGTSIGIGTAYLAMGNPDGKVYSIEGAPAVADIARQTHSRLALKNTEVITGSFEEELPGFLQRQPTISFVFFDGNHTYAATVNYFEQCLARTTEDSIFVFDDIYWSEDMYKAWCRIKAHPKITLTIDVYRFGICFFKKDKLAKEDFVLWC